MKSTIKTTMCRLSGLILLCLFFAIQADAQDREKLIFENYTIKDGLPGNWIRSIDQDSYGYLWIATDAGISRFDGFRFQNYFNDPSDSASLISNDINQILVDHSQQVWVSSSAGIDRFDRGSETFDHFRNDPEDPGSLPSDQVLTLFEASDNNLWVGTTNGLARFDPSTQKFRVFRSDTSDLSSLPSNAIRALTESADKKIWIGTDRGIAIYDPVLDTFSRYIKDPNDPQEIQYDNISNLFIDNDQVLWVNNIPESILSVTNELKTVWRLNLKTGQKSYFQTDVAPYSITDFTQDNTGIIWMGMLGITVNRLLRFDPTTNTRHAYTYESDNPTSLTWSYIQAVFEDSNNILWVGTSRGLSKADRGRLQLDSFAPVPETPFDLRNNIYGITEVKNNLFWFTSDGDVGYSWNKNTGEVKSIPYGGSYGTDYNLEINTLEEIGLPDANGLVWFIGAENMLHSIDTDTYTTKEYFIETDQTDDFVLNSMIKGPENILYLLSSEGLYSFNTKTLSANKITDLEATASEVKYYFAGILYSSDGNIWLTSNLKEIGDNNFRTEITLARYNIEKQELEIIPKDASYLSALGHGAATHIMQDKNGDLWISKTNGLARFDPESGNTQFYDKNSGLPYLSVIGTLEGSDGNIWLSLSNGIARLNPETGDIRNFTKEDGLLPSRMNPYSLYKRQYGELIMGGVGGLNFFHPADISETTGRPNVLITQMDAGASEYKFDPSEGSSEPLTIEWDNNTLEIVYSAVTFQSPEQITYEYRLDGFNDAWVSVGSRSFAQYTNLPPDSYTFNVRAINGEGVRSETSSISFTVSPPWWRTLFAYFSYGLIFVAGVIGADRYQRKRVMEQERERSREKELAQAKEIEKAYTNLKKAQDQLVQQEKLASLGQLTAGIAHEIKNPLNFVNNFSDVSVELVEEIRHEIRSEKSSVASAKDGEIETSSASRRVDGSVRGVSDKKGNPDHDLILDILDDIEANLKTIHKHGSRADSIVKSMLLHSRASDGEMEPTPLNSLIKEYTDLAYHGMRATDNSIDVDIQYELDDDVGEVPLVAEDFSRVVLNIVNNAFEAMREKLTADGGQKTGRKSLRHPVGSGDDSLGDYYPKLTVRTKSDGSTVTIEFEDNGPGISDEIKDKILQPFFTTKKGTEGTGLGLSITNDLIKALGGSLSIKSDVQSTTFAIKLMK